MHTLLLHRADENILGGMLHVNKFQYLSVITGILKQITENVVQLDTADSTTIKSFFKWVSASISTGSQKVEEGGINLDKMDQLPPPPAEVNLVV